MSLEGQNCPQLRIIVLGKKSMETTERATRTSDFSKVAGYKVNMQNKLKVIAYF